LKTEYQRQLVDIKRRAEELGKKEQVLRDKEQILNAIVKNKELVGF